MFLNKQKKRKLKLQTKARTEKKHNKKKKTGEKIIKSIKLLHYTLHVQQQTIAHKEGKNEGNIHILIIKAKTKNEPSLYIATHQTLDKP